MIVRQGLFLSLQVLCSVQGKGTSYLIGIYTRRTHKVATSILESRLFMQFICQKGSKPPQPPTCTDCVPYVRPKPNDQLHIHGPSVVWMLIAEQVLGSVPSTHDGDLHRLDPRPDHHGVKSWGRYRYLSGLILLKLSHACCSPGR